MTEEQMAEAVKRGILEADKVKEADKADKAPAEAPPMQMTATLNQSSGPDWVPDFNARMHLVNLAHATGYDKYEKEVWYGLKEAYPQFFVDPDR